MREYLEKLHSARQSNIPLDYESVMRRAGMADSFTKHPYWEVISRMLSGTIQAETEQLLSNDDHLAVNRASVAICRKVLQMPYFDIEQGKIAESAYESAKVRMARKYGAPEGAEGVH